MIVCGVAYAASAPGHQEIFSPLLFGNVYAGERRVTDMSSGRVRPNKPEDELTFVYTLWNTGQPDDVVTSALEAAS
jgi:hypothetical protein